MKTTGLNFIEAVQAAKSGQKVRRAELWDDAYICVDSTLGEVMRCRGDYTKPLCPLVDDFLATNWEIVPDPPKTMTFMEAVEEMKQGKKVSRLVWRELYRMFLDTVSFRFERGGTERWNLDKCGVPLKLEWLEADDWIVVEEEEPSNE
jgi:hypothetical protein